MQLNLNNSSKEVLDSRDPLMSVNQSIKPVPIIIFNAVSKPLTSRGIDF